MVLLSFLNAGWFSLLFGSNPNPISIPIDLSQAGSVVEKEVKIEESWSYHLILQFAVHDRKEDGGLDGKRVWKFLGFNSYDPRDGKQVGYVDYRLAKSELGDLIDETYDCDGTVVPIKITIHQINQDNTKKLIADNLYMTKGNGSGAYTRDITTISLDKGKYIFRIENIEAFSEMIGRKVDFTIYINKRDK
ncbi:DUF5625 family protein [Sulfurospirillum deleyianum]|uniref:DUF5625 domain-containing protein n=1 Tax=Sulfurospirillum deleyianum (strain ATCC 51133 / DSM 6946 / 5175) TaxID=525898 RepID=D1B2F0_SULD5|nr:DUF5625 family protein [Sulfurospirillum deleyianum]ACZ12270.1 hypothetical protein Sdel_1248 [Sulfurospirillum deleyianum DSM 6946]